MSPEEIDAWARSLSEDQVERVISLLLSAQAAHLAGEK